jgi:hypothetical protein
VRDGHRIPHELLIYYKPRELRIHQPAVAPASSAEPGTLVNVS